MLLKSLAERIPRGFIILFWLAAGVLALMFAGSLFMGRFGSDRKMPAGDLTPAAVDSVVGRGGTPEYNRLIAEDNAIKAREARESGDSFVAVPAGGASAASPLLKRAAPP